jgi:hypothetical protein
MFTPHPPLLSAAVQEFHCDAAAIGDQVLQLAALHGGHFAWRITGKIHGKNGRFHHFGGYNWDIFGGFKQELYNYGDLYGFCGIIMGYKPT